MKHLNYEPDVTGPLEGERLAVILGLAKPHKYQIEEFVSPYKDGVKLCVFEFPKERYAAAFYAPERLVQEAPLSTQTILDIKAKRFVASDIVWPNVRITNAYAPEDVRDHENEECDPYACPVGEHYCSDCDRYIRGALNDHGCSWHCSEHGRTLDIDESCDACTHEAEECEPLICTEGIHECPECGAEHDGSLYWHMRDRHPDVTT